MRDKFYSPSRIRLNVISNIAFLVLEIIAIFFFTPYLIAKLGIAGFGLVALAVTLANYCAGIFMASIQASVGRCMTVALERGDQEDAIKTFNTGFRIASIVAVVSFVLIPLISLGLCQIITIPENMRMQSYWLFVLVLSAVIINIIREFFLTAVYSTNRNDLRNCVLALYTIMRVGLVVFLFTILSAQVHFVGFALLAAAIGSCLLGVVFWKKMLPHICIGRHFIDNTKRIELLKLIGDTAIANVAFLLFTGVDLLLLGMILGTRIAGEYASIIQWVFLVRIFARALHSALEPILLSLIHI